jgi:hypothetical protein
MDDEDLIVEMDASKRKFDAKEVIELTLLHAQV